MTATWILFIGWATRAVLLILVGLSVWSFAIILDRRKAFKNLNTDDFDATRVQLKSRVPGSQGSGFFSQLHSLLGSESAPDSAVRDLFEAHLAENRLELSRGLPVLATLGSNAPFIGLFGTVLGIIQSFGTLSANTTGGMNDVIASLAEALTATAVGLFVAIPAVVAYNVYSQKLRTLTQRSEIIRDLYLAHSATRK
ncbi:MAG: MotA/TolQ/ExbB proton channel family protein [Proteobacteria bacterium]|nr:MAG: MotA/TolQ/ExbB proton channel family protein [Pseudomonadota bacterium]